MSVKEVSVDKQVEQPNKVLDILGYLIFLVPLFTMKNDFDRYHANQATTLAICAFALNVVVTIVSMIPILGWAVGSILSLAVNVIVFLLMIIGMMNVNKLECKPLPVIGNLFQIIKY